MVPWKKTILLWIGFARCWFAIGQTSKALENMQILVPPFLFNPPILERIATYFGNQSPIVWTKQKTAGKAT